jgi:flagellar basal-body rod protein FlgC
MAFSDVLSSLNVSASGLTAERLRMEVVANNIANAFSTRTPGGGPYRRKDVIFETVLNQQFQAGQSGMAVAGVRVLGVVDDTTPFNRVFQPGHPDADANGFVLFPNVQLPLELVNLITANRSYEANLKVLQAFRQEAEQALTLLR